MDAITFAEVFTLMRDSSIRTFTAQIDGQFMSFIKTDIGKAIHVYGNYGLDSDSLVDPKTKYSFEAVVSDGNIYTLGSFELFSRGRNKSDDPGVMSLTEYLSKLNDQMMVIYRAWYNSLPADAKLFEYQRQACADDARQIVIKNGPTDKSMLDAPRSLAPILDSSSAIKVLSGITSLDEFFASWKADKLLKYIELKTTRLLTQEFVRNGGGLSDEDRRIAETLWSLNVKFVTVNFEHNGKAISGKVSLGSVRAAIIGHCFPYVTTRFYDRTEFSSIKEDEKVRQELTGKSYLDIPLDFIQSIVSRGKTVYVREDRK